MARINKRGNLGVLQPFYLKYEPLTKTTKKIDTGRCGGSTGQSKRKKVKALAKH